MELSGIDTNQSSTVNEGYFPIHGSDSQDMRKAKTALANWFKNSIEAGMMGQPLKRSTFDILSDLIDEYADAYAADYDLAELAVERVKLANPLKEGSFDDQMSAETKALYAEYSQKIDIMDRSAIYNHAILDKALVADPRVQKSSQKRLLQRALGWAITFAQQQER